MSTIEVSWLKKGPGGSSQRGIHFKSPADSVYLFSAAERLAIQVWKRDCP
jgi:hypothetical protein